MMNKRRWVLSGAILVVLLVVMALTAAAVMNWRTHLTGLNEVPVIMDSSGQGQAIFQLRSDGQAIEYKLIVANINNVWMSHIHMGAPGTNGPIVVWLYPRQGPPPSTSLVGRTDGVLASGEITAADLTGPLAGKSLQDLVDIIQSGDAYVNVHTRDFSGQLPPNSPGNYPGGEIRGNLP